MTKLAIVRAAFASRVLIEPRPARRAGSLACAWTRDVASGRLVCRWTAETEKADESPPSRRWLFGSQLVAA